MLALSRALPRTPSAAAVAPQGFHLHLSAGALGPCTGPETVPFIVLKLIPTLTGGTDGTGDGFGSPFIAKSRHRAMG